MKLLFLNVNLTLLLAFCLLTASCVVYTEKQSEALSQSVYLADDSFELGRFDVTDVSLNEAIKIVKPPKNRQKISPVNKKISGSSSSVTKKTHEFAPTNNKNVIIVPERFQGQKIVIVNSNEYKKLLEDKQTFLQLQGDYKTLEKLKETVDEELLRQNTNVNKMIIDLNNLQRKVVEKNLLILKLYIVIGALVAALGGGIYLRMKGIL